jgi:hypothetical protein
VSKAVNKFVLIQSQVDLARVACALERFRLAHGNYPESLELLAPQFTKTLPHDIINGQPLHYRRTEDGKFVLYAVGWDEKDDGGKIFFTKNGTVDREKGDWVWQYPAKRKWKISNAQHLTSNIQSFCRNRVSRTGVAPVSDCE